jgi:pimeloyl-ACP methyl ester carboxylesterase
LGKIDPVPRDTALQFGPFRLDPSGGGLFRGRDAVPLPPKALLVLYALARRAGRLVSKQELLEIAWPGVFVGDAVLKVTIAEIRKALGDSPQTPTYIETAHRRGYRFVAPVTPLDAAATPATPMPVAPPPIRYARSGHVNIAYQVVGEGPVDLVFVMGWVSHLEYFWREPSFARFLTRLAAMSRLILFDKRGTGLSDPVPVSQLPTLDERLDDVRAVMEAAGSTRAVLMGVSEGGPLCTLFAATYPERTEALIMIGSYARRLADEDYPWGRSRADHEAFCRSLLEQWGGPVGLEVRAPSRAGDPAFRDWWASYLRMGASPGAAVALTRMNAQIDVRAVLPAVQAPTLVLHRRDDQCLKVEEGRYLASHIPGAAMVELPGADHLPFVGDQDQMFEAIRQFLEDGPARRSRRAPDAGERSLTTVLALGAADGASLERIRGLAEHQAAIHRGHVAGTDGRLWLARFDAPGRAVRCARTIVALARAADVSVRTGVHIGECDPDGVDATLLAAARGLVDAARPGDVLVTRTVVDLVAGAGFTFDLRGLITVPGDRPVATFALRTA